MSNPEVNYGIRILTRNSKGLEGSKNGKAVKNDSLSVYVPFTIKLSNHFIADLKRLHYAYMLLTKKPQFPVAQF